MKKLYHFAFAFLGLLTANAQNKLVEDKAFSKTLKFENQVSYKEAVSSFLAYTNADKSSTFEAKKIYTDASGMSHQRNQQYAKGLKVVFGTMITHQKDGFVVSINGELYNPKNIDNKPKLEANTCFQKAVAQVNAQEYMWENPVQAELADYRKPAGELVYFPDVIKGDVHLAYMFDIYATNPISRGEVYVDAVSGNILYINPIIKHAHNDTPVATKNAKKVSIPNVIGTANTKYSGVRNIETTFNTPLAKYVLNDLTRGNGIVTYNCERLVNTYQDVHFQDNDNNWTLAEHNNNFFDNAAQDAHWGAEMTYDFWKTIYNRDSFDDNNARIRSYVHFQRTAVSLSNAFWNGVFMTYGDGVQKPFTSIDICGHEIGHAVCTYTANLAYRNQSGALNEGFSDIWGACIEHYGRTGSFTGTPVANVWRIGEDIQSGGGLRSMSTPTSKNDPDTFRGTYWLATSDDGNCSPTANNDWCGVHSNSGVLNHWFYILSAGKAGTNNAPVGEFDVYNVTGIGMQKAAEIAYLAERDYLTPNATFFDAREATITIANNLYCQRAPEVIAVTNAWNAVNVGDKHVSFPIDLYQRTIPQLSTVSCSATTFSPTIYFQNVGNNPVTSVNIVYNIDNGPNTTVTWSGNIATCAIGQQTLNINTTNMARGSYKLNVKTVIPGDANLANDSRSTFILVNNATTVNQTNTFENATDNLITYDEFNPASIWERGTSSKTTLTNTVTGNSKVYATRLNDNYSPNQKSYLVSQCYNLSQATQPVLKFDMAFDIEANSDVLYMQYSLNGGTTWSLLGTQNSPNWYTSANDCTLCAGGEWSGEADILNASLTTNGTKREYSYNLSQFGQNGATPQSSMVFRFVFASDGETQLDGAIIDNFRIENTLSNNSNPFEKFSVFPNPTSDFVNISFVSQSANDVKITLVDVQGRTVIDKNFDESETTFDKNIDLSSLPKGFYILKIVQGEKSFNTKVIKK